MLGPFYKVQLQIFSVTLIYPFQSVLVGQGCSGEPLLFLWSNKFCNQDAESFPKLFFQAGPEYGQGMNPISRLAQIQQARKEKEPDYVLLSERGLPRRREFVMQVFSAFIVSVSEISEKLRSSQGGAVMW